MSQRSACIVLRRTVVIHGASSCLVLRRLITISRCESLVLTALDFPTKVAVQPALLGHA